MEHAQMSEKTTNELEKLREHIDSVDQQLLHLLRKRLDLVAQVGGVKHAAGVPIYAPQREASMLAKRREEAAKMNVSPQLIEDILRRLMRESYLNEKDGDHLLRLSLTGGAGPQRQPALDPLTLGDHQT